MGQLGLGKFENEAFPLAIESLSNVVHISAGGMHSACITSGAECYTWGCGTYGQLGLGEDNMVNNSVPTRVDTESSTPLLLKQIACGGMHTGAIDTEGQVWCWGRSDSGQTGIKTPDAMVAIPTLIHSKFQLSSMGSPQSPNACMVSRKAVNISCGGFHTMVVVDDGTVYSMGKDDFGILGLGLNSNSLTAGTICPTMIRKFHCTEEQREDLDHQIGKELQRLELSPATPLRKAAVAASVAHAHASRPPMGEYGTVRVPLMSIKSISCGGWHSVLVSSSASPAVFNVTKGIKSSNTGGQLLSCGKGEYGRLCSGSERSHDEPLLIPWTSSDPVVQASAGGSHTLFRTTNHRVYVCGRNSHHRLGTVDEASDRVCVPVELAVSAHPYLTRPDKKVLQVAAGGTHSLVLIDLPQTPHL